ncbi:class I SAM-dependent methyltransferase [Streptomyces sp. NPDC029080]|uniref:class I SAM-dependent methyltransferase n=1 Tax=Streptomyces sp. NPDC029080 TaxID=3155017 RepID=UPI0033C9BBEF
MPDIGCGTGHLLWRTRAEGLRGRLTGLDPVAAMPAQARRARPDVEWVLGDVADAVLAAGVRPRRDDRARLPGTGDGRGDPGQSARRRRGPGGRGDASPSRPATRRPPRGSAGPPSRCRDHRRRRHPGERVARGQGHLPGPGPGAVHRDLHRSPLAPPPRPSPAPCASWIPTGSRTSSRRRA